MSSGRWAEIRAAFDELAELEEDERAGRLVALEKEDPELHRKVAELLQADQEADLLLERYEPPAASSTSIRDRVSAQIRERLGQALEGRYRLGRELGRGGMAVVYLARDLATDRRVALKALEPDLARAVGPERFLREIGIERRLHHPNILELLDFGEAGGHLYYVMPYVDGVSLRGRLIREGPLPLDEAFSVAVQCADALAHAHRQDVIHRDVKPANILLDRGRAMLVDFGIARALNETEDERLTETGMTLGTVGYMSPEQALGEKAVDARTDVYSLGCVLYEMLAGEPAFRGPTSQAIMARQLAGEVAPVKVVRPSLPSEVDPLIRSALQPDPGERYATAAELAVALRGIQERAAER